MMPSVMTQFVNMFKGKLLQAFQEVTFELEGILKFKTLTLKPTSVVAWELKSL